MTATHSPEAPWADPPFNAYSTTMMGNLSVLDSGDGNNLYGTITCRQLNTSGLTTGLAPSGDLTGVTDSAVIAAASALNLLPGQWYLASPIALAANQVLAGAGPGTVLNQGSAWSGTALIKPTGSSTRVTNLAAVITSTSFIDFANVFMNYFECDHCTVTAGASASDIFTNSNLHRSTLHNLLLTQNNPAATIWTMGSTGTGVSTTSFLDSTLIAGVGASGNRSAPAVSIFLAANKTVDAVWFERLFCNNAQNGSNIDNTQYFFDIACTANAANNDFDRILFRNITFNGALGGAIRCQSVWGIDLDNVNVGNMTTVSGKALGNSILAVATNGASGQHSACVNIRNYLREGGTALGSGVDPSDISITADTQDVTITNPTSADSAAAVQINLNGCSGAQIVTQKTGGGAGTTILNQNNTAAQKTIVIGQGAITVGGTAITVP